MGSQFDEKEMELIHLIKGSKKGSKNIIESTYCSGTIDNFLVEFTLLGLNYLRFFCKDDVKRGEKIIFEAHDEWCHLDMGSEYFLSLKVLNKYNGDNEGAVYECKTIES